MTHIASIQSTGIRAWEAGDLDTSSLLALYNGISASDLAHKQF